LVLGMPPPRAFVLVGTLAAQKRLFLNVRRKYALGTLSGEMSCNINKPLEMF
jgi:hypothetical protein